MPSSLTPNEDEMQFPNVPKDKCLNHPTEKAVVWKENGKDKTLHLCVPCLQKWEKAKEDYEVWQVTAAGGGQRKAKKTTRYCNHNCPEDRECPIHKDWK